MTEPNMELEGVSEKILAVLAARFDRSFSVDDYIELVDKAISEAEKQAYISGFCNAQNGYKETVKKLSDDVEKAEQRGYEKGAAEERRRIVAGLDNGFEEYMVKKADVLSLIHDNK